MKLKPFVLSCCLTALALPQLSIAEELPLLGKAAPMIDSRSFSMLPDTIQFLGGTAVNDMSIATEVNVKLTDVVDIQGSIELRNSFFENAPASVYIFFSLNGKWFGMDEQQQFYDWDEDVRTLKPFGRIEALISSTPEGAYLGSFYQRQVPIIGDLSVHLGLSVGQFFARSEPIKIRINNAEPSKLKGDFVAKEDFLPNPDGFGFENYTSVLNTDLTDEDIIDFLGQEQGCYLSPQGKCILTAYARQFKQQAIMSANSGHCHGMAVASVHLKKGLPFKGKDKLTDFQSGAATTMDLQKSAMRHLIAYYFITQSFEPKLKPQKPSEVLQTIIAHMETNDPIASLGIYKRDHSEGHAITPYAVQDKGNGEFWVYVYDNNYPDNANLTVKINRDQETWYYETRVNPNAPISRYEGDATSNNLEVFPLSIYENFSPLDSSGEVVEFQFAGRGLQMLIENWNEQRIGYDFETGQHVNEIEGAEIVPVFDVGAPPRYRLPVIDKDDITGDDMDKLLGQMFGITLGALSGEAVEQQTGTTSLFMQAGKAMAKFGNINLVPGEKFNVAIHPNAQIAYLNSESTTTQKPTISLTVDDKDKQQGYIYELSDLELVEGTDLIVMISELELDVISVAGSEEEPTFTQLDSSTYSLRVTQVGTSGQRSARSTKLEVPVGAKTRIHVKQWGEESDGRVRTGDREDGNEGVIEVEIIE